MRDFGVVGLIFDRPEPFPPRKEVTVTMTTTTIISTQPASLEEIELETSRSALTTDLNRVQSTNDDTPLTRKNLSRVIAASISFFFAGNNDGSLGTLTPYILRTYNVGTEYVALM